MKMISELFIKQKTWFNFVSFLTEQTLLGQDEGGGGQKISVLGATFYDIINGT